MFLGHRRKCNRTLVLLQDIECQLNDDVEGERERERERERVRERERYNGRERERYNGRERERKRDTKGGKEKERERERESIPEGCSRLTRILDGGGGGATAWACTASL